jgi:hypothetical protein
LHTPLAAKFFSLGRIVTFFKMIDHVVKHQYRNDKKEVNGIFLSGHPEQIAPELFVFTKFQGYQTQ